MEIIYKVGDFPDPGDRDLYNGIQEINKNNYKEALEYFEKGSNYDNEYALLFSAIIYFTGFGLEERNPVKSMTLFKKVSSGWNNCVAQYLVGRMYMEGDEGIPINKKSGLYWVSLAANGGWPCAIVNMGENYCIPASTERNDKKAIDWFEKLANNDDSEDKLVDEIPFHLFGKKDFELSFTHVKKGIMLAAEVLQSEGLISPAKLIFGKMGEQIAGSEELERVLFWDLMAKKKSSGVLACQVALTLIYLGETNSAPLDAKKAAYWAKKAGKNGHLYSCMLVGKNYEDGIGENLDYKEAIKWYARSGQPEAMFRIGFMYHTGKGVERDDEKALTYLLAVTQIEDSGEAYYFMGKILHKGGVNVSKNYKEAYKCYENAYKNGCATGATAIALLYYKGLGVKKDIEKMTEWLQKGRSQGCVYCLGLLSVIHQGESDVAISDFMEFAVNNPN